MNFREVLKSISVYNWYCGDIDAFYAWSNNCTIESKKDQQKIRRALRKVGYQAHFGRGILNVEKLSN